VHLLASAVLAFFVTFFLLYDGENIWRWLVSAFPATTRRGINMAGRQAWNRLAGYVKGTFVIACFHAIVVTITLLILGVPLVAPLGALVFVGSFLPIVGALIFGGLAVIVALITKGAVAAIVLVIVLVADNQIEAHVLQPFLVGRFLRLHPLAVVLAVATGGYLAGIIGAILALPMTAVATAVVGYYVEENRLHKEGIAPDPLIGT
jgi:predicted PurR-regulated permease PerM